MSNPICLKKGCKEPMRPLSFHDENKTWSNLLAKWFAFYRTTTWKCEAGHVTKSDSEYKPKEVEPTPDPLSKKRFHMKYFRGHKVNQVSKHFSKMRSDGFSRDGDGMTNHDRVLRQRAFKEKAAR